MFTIRRTLTLGLGQVKWGASMPIASGDSKLRDDLNQRERSLYEQFKDLKTPQERQDFIRERQLINDQDKLSLTASIDAEIKTETDPIKKLALTALKNSWESDFVALAQENAEKVAAVTSQTSQAVSDVYSNTIQSQVKKAGRDIRTSQADGVDFKDAEGKLTLSAMLNELSDLDRDGDVESKNTSWFSRAIFNKGEQQYLIGELQVKEILGNLSKEQLDALASRLGTPLPWNSNLDVISIKRDPQIAAFQHALIEQATALNIVSKTLLGNVEASAGLASIVYNTEPAFKQELLQNKDAINKINELIKNDRGFGEKLVSALLKVGIMLPVSVLSGGLLIGSVSSRDITVDGEKGGLRLKKNIGQSGSIVGAIEALGVKIEGNWNDPSTRLVGRTQKVLQALKASSPLNADAVNRATEENIASTSKDTFSDTEKKEFDTATADYKKLQADVMSKIGTTQLDEKSQKILLDALVQNALMYNGRVEEIKGFNLKGFFVGAGLSGLAVGVTGSKVSTSATLDANVGASRAEAQVNRQVLTPQKKQELLNVGNQTYTNANGIETVTIKDPKMTPDLVALQQSGHLTLSPDKTVATITTKAGEKLNAHIDQVIATDGSHHMYYRFTVGSATSTPTTSPATAPSLTENWNAKVDDIQRGRELANIMLSIRGARVVEFQKAYAQDRAGNDAKTKFQALLKVFPTLASFWKGSKLDEAKKMQETFEKTQGGGESRRIARSLNTALAKRDTQAIEANKATLTKYYSNTKGLLETFSRESGVDKSALQTALRSYIQTIGRDTKIHKLNVPSQVMFAQKNPDKSTFHQAVNTPAGLPIIGQPVSLGNEKSLALAYEPGAECFNVVIVSGTTNVSTPTVESVETYGIGSLLADRKISMTDIGLAAGVSWDKLNNNSQEQQSPQGQQSSETGSKDGQGVSQKGTHTGATEVKTPPVVTTEGIPASTNNPNAAGTAGNSEP